MDRSKQINDDTSCIGASMYLSFDSNSTMSNAAYKTLEAMCDLSAMGINETGLMDVSAVDHLNNTLEAYDQVEIVKKMDKVSAVADSPRPLKIFNQNILQEYRATSSTPTKRQALQNIKRSYSSEAVCANLGEVLTNAPRAEDNSFSQEENKENANIDSEFSNLSLSAEIITSVIEKKQMPLLSTEKEVLLESEENTPTEEKMQINETEKFGVKENVIKTVQSSTNPIRQAKNLQNKHFRKSVCEPNLNTNRPSRIVTNTKTRASLIPGARPSGQQDVSDIPQLLNKMLKISNVLQKDDFVDTDQNKANSKINKPQIPTAAEKKRNSLLPLMSGRRTCFSQMSQEEKRPFSLTHRMSIVVKTTLNSPACKKARKSFNKTRRSIAPVKSSTAKLLLSQTGDKNSSVNQKQKKLTNRQSLLPTIAVSPKSNILPTVFEQIAKPQKTTSQLKTGLAKKTDPIYTCSFCSRQFRIKSLLDAHKRSHEEDMPTTTAATLPTAAATVFHSSGNNSTQCKYCDKKFAIVRALHIHLMQNCLKIPPAEKRKLQFTEMNHVEKAQLPELFSNASSILTTASKKLIRTNTDLSSTSRSSAESLVNNKGKVTTVESAPTQMAPPSQKLIKKTAHSGVYRTPSKTVPCYLCKQSFKSVMDYTNHTMTVHSSTRAAKIKISDSIN